MGNSQSAFPQISHFSNTQSQGESPAFRSIHIPLDTKLPDTLKGGISTLLQCFETQREKFGTRPLYGTREKLKGSLGKYQWKTYDEVYHICTSLAKAFEKLALLNTVEYAGYKQKTIGVFCKTREEWLYTWIACWYSTACIVPLYDTLGEESIEWIVRQTELRCVVTTTPFVQKLCRLKIEGKLDSLKSVILLDPLKKEEEQEIIKAGLTQYNFLDCLNIGTKSEIKLHPEITTNSLATICYTSGTTSRPKGVMLTHRNYISMACGITSLPFIKPKLDDSCICWLPLAHVFEQFAVVVMLVMGVKVGFFSGDVAKLADDMQVLKPQFFGSVPRVFNRIYDATLAEVAKLKGIKKMLYEKGVETKRKALRETGKYTHWFYDKFVFSKISAKLGGNVGLIFVGGAPLTPEVEEMSKIWLGCIIVQGYGQTETTGPILAQDNYDTYPCSIGSPIGHAEAKIVDVPEMKYFSTDNTNGQLTPRGELWLRSPAVAAGYWREPEMTAETFTKDGWVKTGDIVVMAPSGHIVIIDRKKHIFKLAQVFFVNLRITI